MGIWLIIAVESLLIPAIMVGIGWLFRKRPPKNINPIYGYRTAMSMKNQDTWDFAHRICAEVWIRWGLVLLIVSALALAAIVPLGQERAVWAGTWICLLQLIPLLGSIVPVERALKKTFDQDGNRREENP